MITFIRRFCLYWGHVTTSTIQRYRKIWHMFYYHELFYCPLVHFITISESSGLVFQFAECASTITESLYKIWVKINALRGEGEGSRHFSWKHYVRVIRKTVEKSIGQSYHIIHLPKTVTWLIFVSSVLKTYVFEYVTVCLRFWFSSFNTCHDDKRIKRNEPGVEALLNIQFR